VGGPLSGVGRRRRVQNQLPRSSLCSSIVNTPASPRLTGATLLVMAAEQFLDVRLSSLRADVRHCLRKPPAVFPTLLYCFATIDLLVQDQAALSAMASASATARVVATAR